MVKTHTQWNMYIGNGRFGDKLSDCIMYSNKSCSGRATWILACSNACALGSVQVHQKCTRMEMLDT